MKTISTLFAAGLLAIAIAAPASAASTYDSGLHNTVWQQAASIGG